MQKACKLFFVGLAVAVIGFGGGWLGARSADDVSTSTDAQRVIIDQQDRLVSSVSTRVGQSVVSVTVRGLSPAVSLFGAQEVQRGAGTGVIVSEDGYIVTNRHLVPEGTTGVSVTLADGTELEKVSVVGRTNSDDPLDVAFLKIDDAEGNKLRAAKLGASNDMKVGQSVIAIGNALGEFQNTVTTGIISGYGRSVQATTDSDSGSETLNDLFQTDAAINLGNSGGPLVNLKGEVIGINTAVANQAENIGFAIPIDSIAGMVRSVTRTGKVQRAFLGVQYISLNKATAEDLGLSVAQGAYVAKAEEFGSATVIEGSPAAKAGIKEGDIITKVDGQAINQTATLASLLGRHVPGDRVELTISRDDQALTLRATLGVKP